MMALEEETAVRIADEESGYHTGRKPTSKWKRRKSKMERNDSILFREEVEEIEVSLMEAIGILQNARIVSEMHGGDSEVAYTFSAVEKMLKRVRGKLRHLSGDGAEQRE